MSIEIGKIGIERTRGKGKFDTEQEVIKWLEERDFIVLNLTSVCQGFPDTLVLNTRTNKHKYIEIKKRRNQITSAQIEWLSKHQDEDILILYVRSDCDREYEKLGEISFSNPIDLSSHSFYS